MDLLENLLDTMPPEAILGGVACVLAVILASVLSYCMDS